LRRGHFFAFETPIAISQDFTKKALLPRHPGIKKYSGCFEKFWPLHPGAASLKKHAPCLGNLS
jgi:hypothetical protein